jgi:hypothetical protein
MRASTSSMIFVSPIRIPGVTQLLPILIFSNQTCNIMSKKFSNTDLDELVLDLLNSAKGSQLLVWLTGHSGTGKSKLYADLGHAFAKRLGPSQPVKGIKLDSIGRKGNGEQKGKWIVDPNAILDALGREERGVFIVEGVSDNSISVAKALSSLGTVRLLITMPDPALYKEMQGLKARDAKDVPESWTNGWLSNAKLSVGAVEKHLAEKNASLIRTIGMKPYGVVSISAIGKPSRGWHEASS